MNDNNEPAGDDALARLRERIDATDRQIAALITQRAECAKQAGEVKQASGADPRFYRPEREAEVLRAVQADNRGPLGDETMARLFREIISACRGLEQTLQVAFLGPAGTFTQQAALKHFGHAVSTRPLGAIDEVFREVESGLAHFGVVPVENSTEGVVNHTLDMFLHSPLRICGEVGLRIHHHLLGSEDSARQAPRIYSHQQSLAQCREWLDRNLPGAERQAVSSNAEAARIVAGLEPGTAAAIAGEAAAEIYGLDLIVSNIEDDPGNTTRFLVVGPQSVGPTGDDKTSLMLSARNRPGALYDLLRPLADQGVDLTRIESRPSRREMWDYVFFLDFRGHSEDPPIKRALELLKGNAGMMKVLGSYPKAVL